jgi:hypothetical protein
MFALFPQQLIVPTALSVQVVLSVSTFCGTTHPPLRHVPAPDAQLVP